MQIQERMLHGQKSVGKLQETTLKPLCIFFAKRLGLAAIFWNLKNILKKNYACSCRLLISDLFFCALLVCTSVEYNIARVDISSWHQLTNYQHNWVWDFPIHYIILVQEKQAGCGLLTMNIVLFNATVIDLMALRM